MSMTAVIGWDRKRGLLANSSEIAQSAAAGTKADV